LLKVAPFWLLPANSQINMIVIYAYKCSRKIKDKNTRLITAFFILVYEREKERENKN
jgi:hypothetical protein